MVTSQTTQAAQSLSDTTIHNELLLTCKRKSCGYTWIKRTEKLPKACPKCKSYFWNVEESANEKINKKIAKLTKLIKK